MSASVFVPALAGLAGIGLGAALAQFRWSRDRSDARRAPYDEKRREAYDGLWRVVEQAHVAARLEGAQSAAREWQLLADVNSFSMLNGVYVDDADRQLAFQYIRATLSLLAEIEKAERPEYREMVANTSAFPTSFGPTMKQLAALAEHNEELRISLRDRVKQVMGDPCSTPDARQDSVAGS